MQEQVNLIVGDSHFLPFNCDSFVCATVGFGIRNFEDVSMAVLEIQRVLKPKGKAIILEIVKLKNPLMAKIFFMYFRRITPILGSILAGDREAYTYLPDSVGNFMTANELADIMMNSGFKNVVIKKFALGSVAILVGEK
jgi:demethylmenaquinone methyltransferase/2-methoxy-6-polyprenyl-1,4-benzoquinol methylase